MSKFNIGTGDREISISVHRDTAVITKATTSIERLAELEESPIAGKWIFGFSDAESALLECGPIVGLGLAVAVKASLKNKGNVVACAFMNTTDVQAHRKLLAFLAWRNLIPKTKAGKFTDIPFKLNSQTRAGEYGKDFKAKLSLGDVINLDTGEWTYTGKKVLV